MNDGRTTHEEMDVILAATDVIRRMGATQFEVGYLDDTPLSRDAHWWACARWQGTRVTVEDHTSPGTAADALARQLLNGGLCTHCNATISLVPTNRAHRRAAKLCGWTRQGPLWVRGCATETP